MSLATRFSVRSTALAGFAAAASANGVDTHAILHEAGVSGASLLDVDAFIPIRRVASLLDLVSHRTHDAFAFDWAQQQRAEFSIFSPSVALAHRFATCGDWLAALARSLSLQTDAFDLKVIRAPANLTMRMTSTFADGPPPLLSEFVLVSVALLVQTLTPPIDARSVTIRLRKAPADGVAERARALGATIVFASAHDEIVFDDATTSARVQASDRDLVRLLSDTSKLRTEGRHASGPSIAQSVELAILVTLGNGCCDFALAAAALGLHPKKLQRTLNAAGQSYSEIIDRVRQERARRWVRETSMPIERIAGLLDYSSTPPFTLAFKRWTGASPMAFRRQSVTVVG